MKRSALRSAVYPLLLIFIFSGSASCASSERYAVIESFTRTGNERTLSIGITIDPCETLGLPEVVESDSVVTVRIRVSRDANAKCETIRPLVKEVEIRLSAPLDTRAVRGPSQEGDAVDRSKEQ